MNAIEIRGLRKNFGNKQAVNGLDMTVPCGAIYGFIGENGSGKSTTEKIICGLISKNEGSVKIYDRDHTDPDIRERIGVLIEQPGCFPSLSVWNNLMIQATNLNIKDKKEAVRNVLTLVRMEGTAGNKFRNCSLGMKQRIGIAMALLGNPRLLVLDEPINGLDADGIRIMREVLTDLSRQGVTIIISSHLLGELEKIATHYGIIRRGKMLLEMSGEEFEQKCPKFIALKTADLTRTKLVLDEKYDKVIIDEKKEIVRIYDEEDTRKVIEYLYSKDIVTEEITTDKISLEEFYIELNQKEEA